MKSRYFLRGTLVLLGAFILAPGAWAQTQVEAQAPNAPAAEAPNPGAAAPVDLAEDDAAWSQEDELAFEAKMAEARDELRRTASGGLAIFLRASDLMVPGPQGGPASESELSPSDNLRLQILAVERNEAALASLRQAIDAGIELPTTRDDSQWIANIVLNRSAREFARLLAQEAAVCVAERDVAGAIEAHEFALELGRQWGRGLLMDSMVASSLDALARGSILRTAPALDAGQSQGLAARWETIAASRSTLAQVLGREMHASIAGARFLLEPAQREQIARIHAAAPNGTETNAESETWLSREEAGQLLELSPDDIETNLRRLFERAIERSALPFRARRVLPPLGGEDAITRGIAESLNATISGSSDTRLHVQEQLAIAALRLRAHFLENGSYPAAFEAGADPFSPTTAPYIYRLTTDSYLLYSIGPNGIDDGGQAVTRPVDLETGGDIVAPVIR